MKFPILNISVLKWKTEDLLEYVLHEKYIYTNKEELFNRYFKDIKYCDRVGKVYRVIEKEPPNSFWRNLFRFLPNVYRVELRFIATGEKLKLEEMRSYVISRIKDLEQTNNTKVWINDVKKAKSYSEIFEGF